MTGSGCSPASAGPRCRPSRRTCSTRRYRGSGLSGRGEGRGSPNLVPRRTRLAAVFSGNIDFFATYQLTEVSRWTTYGTGSMHRQVMPALRSNEGSKCLASPGLLQPVRDAKSKVVQVHAVLTPDPNPGLAPGPRPGPVSVCLHARAGRASASRRRTRSDAYLGSRLGTEQAPAIAHKAGFSAFSAALRPLAWLRRRVSRLRPCRSARGSGCRRRCRAPGSLCPGAGGNSRSHTCR